ncbi:MAG: response regulator [Betaproteobacteria bacterium]|nr:response regulator [Betaproteobacteria bacterium]
MIQNWFRRASWSSRLALAPRAELEQSLLRFGLVGAVYVYLALYVWKDGALTGKELEELCVGAGFFFLSIALVAAVLLSSRDSVPRRIIGIVADNAATTYFLFHMGESGAIVVGIYLFVSFGNGFRFGRYFLHLSQALGLIGFTSVLIFSDFWFNHLGIGVGYLAGMIVLPFYVGVLAQRITEARKKADEANQAKGRFLANVSHEMRTPLNGVIAMADVLRETSLNETQREIVETMTSSANLLLAQIEDVLDMTKIEAGRVQLEVSPFDLGRLLTTTVKIVLPQARYKGLTVHTDVAPEAAGWFNGDVYHLRQVLLNLLANAVKFTEKGQISLRVRAIGEIDDVAMMRFEVEDTGIGIPTQKQASIFDPFTQADDSITRVYGGTGLGTTIAKHLVTLMGGRIALTSEVGVGTRFWFDIPLPKTEAQGVDFTAELVATIRGSAAVSAMSAGNGANVHKLRRARILVAEDNPTNQRVTQMILESRGHSVTIVNNGEAALDALERGGFDIALFDLSMPVVSGLEALKLYKFATRNPIPTLILSANVTTELIDACMQAGAAEFVQKPLRASILLEAVERHLQVESQVFSAPPARTEERPSLQVVNSDPLDVAVLSDLGQLSQDPTFVERLIKGFCSDMERIVSQITEAIAERKYETVKDAAHALKGGSASVGANQLVQLAVRLERTPHDALRLRATQWTEDLLRTSSKTRDALETYLEERRNKLRSTS